MRNKKVLIFFLFIASVLMYAYYRYINFYKNDFTIVKHQKIYKNYEFVFVNEAGESNNIYVMSKNEEANFKRGKPAMRILTTKRIRWDDIHLKQENLNGQKVYVVTIPSDSYMSGSVLHFQNYFWVDKFKKEFKVFLKVDE